MTTNFDESNQENAFNDPKRPGYGERPGHRERPEWGDRPSTGKRPGSERPGPREHGFNGRRDGFGPGFGRGPGGFGFWSVGPTVIPPTPFGGPRRTPRGGVGMGILGLLADRALNGYALMQAFAEKSGGNFAPKSGAVYPALNKLVESGLIQVDETGEYSLTDHGRKLVDSHQERIAHLFGLFDQEQAQQEVPAIHQAYRKLGEAFNQLLNSGTEEQQARITDKIDQLRRDIYRELAE